MRQFIIILTLVVSVFGYATSVQNDYPEFQGQGKLVILRIVPGDKTAKLFVVGHKTAEIDLKKQTRILSVFLNSSHSQEELRINDRGDFYEVNGLPNNKPSYVLSVKTKVNDQIEDIKINIKNKMP